MSPRFDSPPASPGAFTQPRPRPPKSSAHAALVRVRNRRREYLARNPGYFKSSEHELSDPLLYDSLVRRFQSPAEREEEGRQKGYARILEGSLMRGEERLAQLAAQQNPTRSPPNDPEPESLEAEGRIPPRATVLAGRDTIGGVRDDDEDQRPRLAQPPRPTICPAAVSGAASFTTFEVDLAAASTLTTREDGLEQWEAFLRERFVRGEDDDFEYPHIDNDDEYDVIERREREEAWFDEEDPEWASSGDGGGSPASGTGGGDPEKGVRVERLLEGETGAQDY
ncbi:coiled-coil domain-containing protein-domain-containing protein [Cercophora scortea]|uniref:Coiled-coil domain-containing protein-domain-containing protein n=1 Tax=Cercophora scortea TaxID=314031 RepID=A0AAE0MNE7_9PEZI|nr:coiled-coil domain-containing protein-domain-containing protein [Cercophora scortea]